MADVGSGQNLTDSSQKIADSMEFEHGNASKTYSDSVRSYFLGPHVNFDGIFE